MINLFLKHLPLKEIGLGNLEKSLSLQGMEVNTFKNLSTISISEALINVKKKNQSLKKKNHSTLLKTSLQNSFFKNGSNFTFKETCKYFICLTFKG
jgi:hypothetical protein